MPFWLQLVGAGMTAAWSLHFGGVLQQARWPAVNCHQLFENDLLTQPIIVENGFSVVPDRPGIGYEVDRDAVDKLKVPKPSARPEPERLIETTWADGRRMYTANNGKVNFMLTAGNEGKYGHFLPGANTRLVPNDGTEQWRSLYQKAREHGPIEG
jgi:galactonate dehydratase